MQEVIKKILKRYSEAIENKTYYAYAEEEAAANGDEHDRKEFRKHYSAAWQRQHTLFLVLQEDLNVNAFTILEAQKIAEQKGKESFERGD